MRALVIWIVAWLCACVPSNFDDFGAAKDRRGDRDSGEALEDAVSPAMADDAAQGSLMDAASETGSNDPEDASTPDAVSDARAVHDATVFEAGAQDAAMRDAAAQDAAAQDAAPPPPACAAPRILCAGACIDPRSDPRYCGSCAIACDPGDECVERNCLSGSGCSDNTREGFPDRVTFPTIAGCSAAWPMASMRAPRVQSACGNSLRMCNVPAEACALGWHVCGSTGPADVTTRVTSTQCNTTPGRWAGALGDISCEDCSSATASGSICCGAGCVQQNADCLWPNETAWFGVVNDVINLCTGTENPQLYVSVGVLCCRDALAGTKPDSEPATPLF
jgi:hypothetical protein